MAQQRQAQSAVASFANNDGSATGESMGSFSIFHWIIVLVFLTIPFPIAAILKRDGRSPFWALLFFVPLINIIALWIWAYVNPDS